MTDDDRAERKRESSDEPNRSAVSDELGVPDRPPDPERTPHVLSDEDLRYPEFVFDEGTMASDGEFDLERSLDRDELRAWLEDLRGGLASHDVAVSTPEDVAILGVGSGDVSMSFDPDEDHSGTFEVTVTLDAKLMTFSDDPNEPRAGAREGTGFVPLDMLTSEADPQSFRCYNWIDDPIDRE